MRGYFGIGIVNGKTVDNLGTLWRSASNFDAAFIFTVGNRYKKHPTDTLKTYRHIPLFQYRYVSDLVGPHDCKLIGIEQSDESTSLVDFKHPERAMYIPGAEDNGLPDSIIKSCHDVIHIPTPGCINVAVAGSIVMYDRQAKIEREL